MLPLHAALVKGFFAEEGLRVQGMRGEVRTAVEEGKAPSLWVKTDTGLSEADFGFLEMSQLHNLAAGQLDYYVVAGMNFGCAEVMVPADSPMKSAAELKGKTIALPPEWGTAFRIAGGPSYLREELQASGLDPNKDVTFVVMPWEALPRLNDYVAEGFKTGKFAAVAVPEPAPLGLRQQQLARPVVSQIYQAPYSQEYCCMLAIRRALVDREPDKAALIVRAFRHAKQWVTQNPVKAVIAAQAAGYYAAAAVQPSANAVVSILGGDREVDLAPQLERAFQKEIEMGRIKTDKTAQALVRLHYRKIE